MLKKEPIIAIIGLGYVGLPLAIAFSKYHKVIGYDIDNLRVDELNNKIDSNKDVKVLLYDSTQLQFTSNDTSLINSTIKIITVPTPIDNQKKPNLNPLKNASETVAKYLNAGDVIIYESTVYPGCTEEVCVPILQKSGLRYNEDFFVGYSPERISPGDAKHTLETVVKVTSGSDTGTADIVDQLYKKIITAGTYKAPSIKVAEAAKMIENVQRDLNVSLVNELALIFDKLNLDTKEVLDTAATKWNFMHYKPGLVGGHCIGVDPYYLLNKAETVGYQPEVILSGRRVNEGMANFITDKVIKMMVEREIFYKQAKVLILGFAYKENSSDFRNTKIIDVYNRFKEFGLNVAIHDPLVDQQKVKKIYGISLIEKIEEQYDAIVFAVPHKPFFLLNLPTLKRNQKSIVYDVKSVLDKKMVDSRL